MQRKFILAASAILLAITLAYSNYFPTGLHSGDYSSIRDNPAIRSLKNIPSFFFDSSTSNTKPADYAYQPVVTTSFAVDYFLGRGSPFLFHLSSFLIYLAGLAMIAWLFYLIFERTIPHPWNPYLAIVGTALFGLHPAVAEMLNPVSQRGELYAALGVVGGIVLYAGLPDRRPFALYLIPPLLGVLSHPFGLIFGPMLFAYILLVEPSPKIARDETLTPEQLKSRDQTQSGIESPPSRTSPKRIRIRRRKRRFRAYLKAQIQRFMPALLFTLVAGGLHLLVTPFRLSGDALTHYVFTQPLVAWRYFRSFFAPFYLAPASDLVAFTSYHIEAVKGLAFLLGLISVAVLLGVSSRWRPVYFGLCWFVLGIFPGAVFPQPDVESDTRMFLPCIGLALAVTWTARLLLPAGERWRMIEAAVAVALLLGLGFGTFMRNRVWSNEETLWRDTIQKHPASVRGLQNYALVLVSKGRANEAYDYLWRAFQLSPGSPEVEANLATAAAALNRPVEAEQHFYHARSLAANPDITYLPYGTWLESRGRRAEALDAYSWASTLAPTDLRPRYGLMRLYVSLTDWYNLRKTVEEAREVAPGDPGTESFAAIARQHPVDVEDAEALAKKQPTPDNYLTLSDAYCRAGAYAKCLEAAHQALQLRPTDAAAYNNISEACISMDRLDDAVAAVKRALEIDPENKIAHANLNNLIDWQHQQHKVVVGGELVVGNGTIRK